MRLRGGHLFLCFCVTQDKGTGAGCERVSQSRGRTNQHASAVMPSALIVGAILACRHLVRACAGVCCAMR